jgi:NodT family efflux transporter outer membrane factor (OMF) lipoprotein
MILTVAKRFLLGLLLSLLISGCVNLGPDYQRPDAAIEPDWLEINDPLINSGPFVDPKWWSNSFNDQELDGLIEAAIQQNLTLRSAGLRVLQAQQQLAIAVGNQFPQQQQANGSASRQKASGVTFNQYQLGLNVSWEVDFWGRFRDQVKSASANLDASVASYDGAMVSLVSQVAQNYILIRTFQDRLIVAQDNIKFQAESMRVAEAKLDAGEVSELDVDQAETLLNNTKATIPSLATSLQQFKNSLAVLLGQPPHEFDTMLSENSKIPSVPAEVALGMPQDLIRRRPDIRIAERQLAAQSAQIGFAVTELYPHLTIGGGIGTSGLDTGDLFENTSNTWSFLGMFEWNIFNYGRLQSNVRLQDALFQQLLVDYRNTVLLAQSDIENAIVAYLKSHEEFNAYGVAAAASQRSVNIARIQYQEGAIGFNRLLTTLKSNVEQQDLFKSTQGSVATNLVQVYKELGGGWEIRANMDPVELLPASTKDEMRQRTRAWNGVLK